MTYTIKDNKIYDDQGNEKEFLTEYELNELYTTLYPKDKVLNHKDTSYTGIHINYDIVFNEYNETNRISEDTVYALGGDKLLALYTNDFDYVLAAKELGITK